MKSKPQNVNGTITSTLSWGCWSVCLDFVCDPLYKAISWSRQHSSRDINPVGTCASYENKGTQIRAKRGLRASSNLADQKVKVWSQIYDTKVSSSLELHILSVINQRAQYHPTIDEDYLPLCHNIQLRVH